MNACTPASVIISVCSACFGILPPPLSPPLPSSPTPWRSRSSKDNAVTSRKRFRVKRCRLE